MRPVFDGHNDLLSKLWAAGDRTGAAFFNGTDGDVDLAKCCAGGFAGGFFAVWVPGDPATAPDPMATCRAFEPVDTTMARQVTLEQAAILHRMSADRPDAIRLCRSVAEIESAQAAGAIAALLHIEGCEGIGPDLDELYLYHSAGLRSLGPVWSRDNIFGHGVPFNFPASPDTGPGLTAAGRQLLSACNRLRILFDLSHLNEAGFWDVAKLTDAPMVATHSGAHTLTPATRNLTDRQLDAIAESKGLVGLNFGVAFLRTDGVKNADTGPEVMLRHIDHLIARLGEGGVALGSDFDGTMIPHFMGSAAGLPALGHAMEKAGYGTDLIARLCWGNWLDVLRRTIG
ncbi:MAG: membrane dipeptidase [Pseudotabrizicola sp.]|uniref:dipeptidase n=1 Tax=Pseudotabrizicola sp. TaxID=2939647 RepID=UPI002717A61F|nr:membrane dipeptidase [Pseudotabrizicola sp.]MDO9637014.1 membrane dipeptidase [Pseudotabrizicola sp.]